MNTYTSWVLVLVTCVGFASSRLTQAADKAVDFGAEAKQASQEADQEEKDRAAGIKGKRQRTFIGTFTSLDPSQNQKLDPDVVGMFDTDKSDKKPGRTYQVKLMNGNNTVLDKLKSVEGKIAQIQGSLRILDQNGEAKYLLVISVIPVSASPPVVDHTKFGGL